MRRSTRPTTTTCTAATGRRTTRTGSSRGPRTAPSASSTAAWPGPRGARPPRRSCTRSRGTRTPSWRWPSALTRARAPSPSRGTQAAALLRALPLLTRAAAAETPRAGKCLCHPHPPSPDTLPTPLFSSALPRPGVFCSGGRDAAVNVWDASRRGGAPSAAGAGDSESKAGPPELIFQHAGHRAEARRGLNPPAPRCAAFPAPFGATGLQACVSWVWISAGRALREPTLGGFRVLRLWTCTGTRTCRGRCCPATPPRTAWTTRASSPGARRCRRAPAARAHPLCFSPAVLITDHKLSPPDRCSRRSPRAARRRAVLEAHRPHLPPAGGGARLPAKQHAEAPCLGSRGWP